MREKDNPLLAFLALSGLGLGSICFWQYSKGNLGLAAAIIGMTIGAIMALGALWPSLAREGEAELNLGYKTQRPKDASSDRLRGSKPITEGRMIEKASGLGSSASIPIEIKGWNWGAFLLTWIWGVSHGVWISLLCFIPLVNIVMIFVLGANGNEWAWQKRKWDSIEHFKRTQRTWAWWGLGVFVAGIVLWIILFVLAGA